MAQKNGWALMKQNPDKRKIVKKKSLTLKSVARPGLRTGLLAVWILVLVTGSVLIHPHGLSAERDRRNRRVQRLVTDIFPFYANRPWAESFRTDFRNIYPVRGGAWPSPTFAGRRFGIETSSDRLLGFAFAMPVQDDRNARLFIGFDLHGKVAGCRVLRKNLLHDFNIAPQSALSPRAVDNTLKAAVVFFNRHRQSWILQNPEKG